MSKSNNTSDVSLSLLGDFKEEQKTRDSVLLNLKTFDKDTNETEITKTKANDDDYAAASDTHRYRSIGEIYSFLKTYQFVPFVSKIEWLSCAISIVSILNNFAYIGIYQFYQQVSDDIKHYDNKLIEISSNWVNWTQIIGIWCLVIAALIAKFKYNSVTNFIDIIRYIGVWSAFRFIHNMSPKQLLSNWYDFHINSALTFKKEQSTIIDDVIQKLENDEKDEKDDENDEKDEREEKDENVDINKIVKDLKLLKNKINPARELLNPRSTKGSFNYAVDKAIDSTLNRWMSILIGILGFIIGLMSLLVKLSSFTFLTTSSHSEILNVIHLFGCV